MRVTASGGARTIDDLFRLRDQTPDTIDSAIVGRALYDGTIEVASAIKALSS